MKLHELKPAAGSTAPAWRKGRGPGSGNGKTAGKVLLKPAAEGTGIIAGATVRAVVEMAGNKNIRTKCLRSSNPTNVVKATFEGLRALRTAEEVAQIRDKSVADLKA